VSDHPDDRTEARLRDARSTEAAMVQPGGDGLQRIREGVAQGQRPWWQVPALVLGTAAVVLGVATGAYLGTRGDDGGTAVADSGTPSASPSSGDDGSSQNGSTGATAPSTTDVTVSPSPTANAGQPATYVYFIHGDPTGPRLYREQHPGVGKGDRAARGLRRMLRGNPDDPDYATPWDGTKLLHYTSDGAVANVDLSNLPDLAPDLAGVATQEIVYTVTANDPTVKRVRFLVQGAPVTKAPFDAMSAPVARAPRSDVQGLIWLLAPAQDATVGSPVSIDGFGTAFEGTVSWDVRQAGRLVAQGSTQAGANGEFAPFHDTVKLEPGTYELSAYESSAETGDPTHVDTKTFTVR
jgi:hypothetical protein